MKRPAHFLSLCTTLIWAVLITADELPRLTSALKSDGKVEISWPKGFDSFHLESSAGLGATAQWQNLAENPVATASGVALTITPGERRRFFRLSQAATGARIVETSPAAGEAGVAVTRET